MKRYVYDRDRALLGFVEAFEFLRWTRRYSQCGSFERKAVATPHTLSIFI